MPVFDRPAVATVLLRALLCALTPTFSLPADAQQMDMAKMPDMTMSSGTLGQYPMTQDASGTAWQPVSTPMQGLMWSSGGWSGMAHGYVDLVDDRQGTARGGDTVFSESMLMVTAQHGAGPGTLTFKSMVSLDPVMGPYGYPLLLQTGETGNGTTPLIDRQHPHNLLMELAGVYAVPIAAGTSAFLYAGFPGEPALGPATFMHRASGEDDPAAPISHHWLDSTHITFGVVTAGVTHGPLKIEASVFNGREPDQHRWGFQPFRLDSWSTRVTLNPTRDLSFQVSYGYLHSPEQLTPDENQKRLTASGTYNRHFAGGNWQTTLAWGQDRDQPGNVLAAWLLESALTLGNNTLFARAETVQKDDLLAGSDAIARVSETTLGYVYDIPVARHVALGLGLQGTVNYVPASLRAAYGTSNPTGAMPFVRLKIR
jgi:hypothetical protein